jgi:hypothetical protein
MDLWQRPTSISAEHCGNSVNRGMLLYSVQHELKQYEIRIIRRENSEYNWQPFTVQILDKGQEVYSFRAHDETVFTDRGHV